MIQTLTLSLTIIPLIILIAQKLEEVYHYVEGTVMKDTVSGLSARDTKLERANFFEISSFRLVIARFC